MYLMCMLFSFVLFGFHSSCVRSTIIKYCPIGLKIRLFLMVFMKVSKTSLLLLGVIIFAFVLRFIVVQNLDVSSDEMIYSLAPYNIISAGALGTIDQSPLYFYLTDITYHFFSHLSPLVIRFTSLLFGLLTCAVIFLYSRHIFQDKKAALFSAVLFATSGYAILYNYEMDMGAFFFALLSMYFFIQAFEKPRFYFYSAVFFALGVLIKNIILVFVPVYIAVFAYHEYKHRTLFQTHEGRVIFKKDVLKSILSGVLVFLFIISPVLFYNYIVYQEKGIADFYFAGVIGSEASPIQGISVQPWHTGALVSTAFSKFKELARADIIVLLFGGFGVFLSLWKPRKETILLLLSLLFLMVYVGGKTASSTHFLWIPVVLSILGGYSIALLFSRFPAAERIMTVILFAAICINAFFIIQESRSQHDNSLTVLLREYVPSIPNEALVIVDPRVYRGIDAWVFHDKHYLEGNYAPQLFEQMNSAPGQAIQIPLYYVECSPKGKFCGWKPEDFERIAPFGEQLSAQFKNITTPITEIGTKDVVAIHKGVIGIKPGFIEAVDRTHQHWGYSVGWKYPEDNIDYYEAEGFLKFLHVLGLIILYIDVLIALISIPLVFVLALRGEHHAT